MDALSLARAQLQTMNGYQQTSKILIYVLPQWEKKNRFTVSKTESFSAAILKFK